METEDNTYGKGNTSLREENQLTKIKVWCIPLMRMIQRKNIGHAWGEYVCTIKTFCGTIPCKQLYTTGGKRRNTGHEVHSRAYKMPTRGRKPRERNCHVWTKNHKHHPNLAKILEKRVDKTTRTREAWNEAQCQKKGRTWVSTITRVGKRRNRFETKSITKTRTTKGYRDHNKGAGNGYPGMVDRRREKGGREWQRWDESVIYSGVTRGITRQKKKDYHCGNRTWPS